MGVITTTCPAKYHLKKYLKISAISRRQSCTHCKSCDAEPFLWVITGFALVALVSLVVVMNVINASSEEPGYHS
jgi:uncharacterized protein (UPF0212 family)